MIKTLLPFLLLAGCATTPRGPIGETIEPPRPLMPPRSARVDTRQPALLWQLPRGTEAAHVELCRDKACADIFDQFDVGKTRVQLPRPLPPGDVWWRLRGRRGERLGATASEVRHLNVDVRVTLTGRHVTVMLPEDEPRLGQQLCDLADAAVEKLVDVFGLPALRDRIPMTILLTQQGINAAAGMTHTVEGVSAFKTGDISFMLPRLAGENPTLPAGVSIGAWLAVHELAHAVRARLSSNSYDQPTWLIEGAADHIAERVLDPEGRNPGVATIERLRRVRESLGTTRFIPLAKLLLIDHTEHHGSDAKTFYAIYDESYAFNRFLDSGERRERYRALLRQVSQMSRALLPTRVAARVRELFGDLGALEREWIASLRAETLPPWQNTFRGEVVYGADGSLLLQSRARQGSVLTPTGDRVPSRIHFTFESDGARQIIVLVGDAGLRLVNGGPARFGWGKAHLYNGETWTLTPGPHQVDVTSTPDHFAVTVDGQRVLEAALDEPIPPPGKHDGPWALGVFDGRVTYRDIRTED